MRYNRPRVWAILDRTFSGCGDGGTGLSCQFISEEVGMADLTADFVYARLQQAKEAEPAGYSPAELDRWADVARGWAKGESPDGLHYVAGAPAPTSPREVFTFFIAGDKVRNPAAAEALTARLA